MQVLPNISLPAVALSTDHLRTHPVGGAGHGADPGARHADGLEPLTGAEISKFHVAYRVPEDVGTWDPEFPQISGGSHVTWENIGHSSPTFDVPVDDHVAVQVGHAFQDLPRVLPGHIFRQCTVGLQLVFDGTLERKQLLGKSTPHTGPMTGSSSVQTHPGHVLHEDGEGLLNVVPQTAVVLNDALVTQVFQQLDLALQSADLLRRCWETTR